MVISLCYRPQSFGKVLFLYLSVIPSGDSSIPPSGTRSLLDQTPLSLGPDPPEGTRQEVISYTTQNHKSGWYASYWNFFPVFLVFAIGYFPHGYFVMDWVFPTWLFCNIYLVISTHGYFVVDRVFPTCLFCNIYLVISTHGYFVGDWVFPTCLFCNIYLVISTHGYFVVDWVFPTCLFCNIYLVSGGSRIFQMGGTVLSQMGGRTSCFQVKSA